MNTKGIQGFKYKFSSKMERFKYSKTALAVWFIVDSIGYPSQKTKFKFLRSDHSPISNFHLEILPDQGHFFLMTSSSSRK